MRLVQFGTYVLPLFNKRDVLSQGTSDGALVSLSGGAAWDSYMSDQAPEGVTELTTMFEIVESTAVAVQTEYEAIRARRGLRSLLWVQMPDGTFRYVSARLSKIKMERRREYVFYQPIELVFEVSSPGWNGSAHGAPWHLDSGYMLDGGKFLDTAGVTTLEADGSTTATLANNGNRPVTNAVITLTAKTSSVSNIRITCAPCDISYTGTVAAGDLLVINCGTRAVTNDGANAYSGFSLESGHTVPEWLNLAAGNNTAIITYSGNATADATITWAYNDGWE